MVPLITASIKVSLSTDTVPKQFKQAAVMPLLKKHGLDTDNLKHFIPGYDLLFVSEVLEKVGLRPVSYTHLTLPTTILV